MRAYEYGCLLPLAGLDAAIDQMRRRVRLWNALVELHEPYRQERFDLIQRLRAERGIAEGDRLKLDDADRSIFKAIDEREHGAVLAAKHAADLYWCNAGEVLGDFGNAVKRARGQKLRFHSSRGYGKTTVRWQTGLPVAAAAGTDGRLRLAPTDNPARWTMQVRVGSTEGRQPVWLTIPVILHRPLPPGGLIRQVSVVSERVGPHDGGNPWLWKAVCIVETPEVHPVPAGAGRIGIDIGWRQTGEELRVAYWHDDRGRSGEVRLDRRFLDGMRKCEDLRSIRDQHFNVAKAALAAFREAAVSQPGWFREAAANAAQWRSPERLTGLVWRWKDERFDGDAEVFEQLAGWRRRERHLWAWEANSRDQLLKRRLHQYRVFAAGVARAYQHVTIEEFDLRPMADLEHEGGELPDPVRHNRVMAACSVLRLALVNACEREGVVVETAKAENTTRQCSRCGHVHEYAIVGIVHTCENCGEVWDQDWNAARNLVFANRGGS